MHKLQMHLYGIQVWQPKFFVTTFIKKKSLMKFLIALSIIKFIQIEFNKFSKTMG